MTATQPTRARVACRRHEELPVTETTHWDNVERIGNTHFTTSRGADRNWNLYYFAVYTRVVEAMLAGERRDTVFDCGTSFGDWLPFLRSQGFRCVIGAEIDPGRASRARERGYDDVFVGDAAEAPYDDGSIDAVVSSDVFVHILRMEDKLKVLQRMRELLRPGGCMIVNHASIRSMELDGDYHVDEYVSFISLDRFLRLVQDEAGFAVEDIQPTYRHWRGQRPPRSVDLTRRFIGTPLGPRIAEFSDRLLGGRVLPIEESDAFYVKLRKR